jgi:hypothetical protein
MNLFSGPKWILVGLGLVMGSMFLSWLVAIAVGGFKLGSLERSVQHRMRREEYAAFWERMRQRLLQIGFVPGAQDGVFTQGGAQFGNMATYTHAKTKKEFRARATDNGEGITVELSLRYLDPIVGDTGECAYRDMVLDYASGVIEQMGVVSNRSFGALSCFVGGIVAILAVAVMKLADFSPVLPPILTFTVAEIVTAILAIVAIRSKPRELTGLWLAITGIGLSLLAIVVALVVEVLKVL